MVTRRLFLASLSALIACQSKSTDAPPPAPKDAAAAVEEPPPIDASDEPTREPEPPDPGKLLAELGAVSAWQAVVDRAQYLARRGQQGVAYGTLGGPVLVPAPPTASDAGTPPSGDAGLVPSRFVWLVDDTEGDGALAIRVELADADKNALKPGDRVALRGAWVLDDDRRWYWKVEEVTRVPPTSRSDASEPPAAPGLEIAEGSLPPGARPISAAKDNDVVYFTVVGTPALPGDGWRVADKLGAPVVALVNLPGERPSYGGQDFRTPDERWQLRRGQVYWLRIGRIRRPVADKPALINARTAPVRVTK